jgi:hypothetical protein
MAKKKTKAQKANELEDRRQKIEGLKAEAKTYGIYITADRLNEVTRVVNKLRKSLEGKPPCYWRNYDRIAKECRICEIRQDCARGEHVPAEIPVDELKPAACRKCGTGQLNDELRDPAGNQVRDYGCSNKECTGTLSEQVRWVEGEEAKEAKEDRARKKRQPRVKVERSKQGKKLPLRAELQKQILDLVETDPGCNTRTIMGRVKGGATRKMVALNELVEKSKIKRTRADRGYRFWPAD